jgi:hypothetical protein
MKIEMRDVLYWMDAIRQSDDRYRTLESFWKGQINSKVWLIDNLKNYFQRVPYEILICGGWNGVMSTLLFNSELDIARVTSMDKDPTCESIANTMNKEYEIRSQFKAITMDMLEYRNYHKHNLIINTSCEHLSKQEYDRWISLLPTNTKIILQSNDYAELDEHRNCPASLDDFEKTCGLSISFSGELATEKYTRFMIIGEKHEG